jgi:hypothetical protein|tara:strand:+ start:91 stop:333 length:243 start_codon:yes stop_codon:yes gene_type:complete
MKTLQVTTEELELIHQALVNFAVKMHRKATSISGAWSEDMDAASARRDHEAMLRFFDAYGAATDIAERCVNLIHSEGGAA